MHTTVTTTIAVSPKTISLLEGGMLVIDDNDGQTIYITGISPEQWVNAYSLEIAGARLPEFV